MMNEDAYSQNDIFFVGENLIERFEYFLNGRTMIMAIDIAKAITPPNLLGIERRIA